MDARNQDQRFEEFPIDELPIDELPLSLILAAENFPNYRLELKRMTRRGVRLMVQRGGQPGCAPVGYFNRREKGRACIVQDPVQAPLVREAFEMASRGRSLTEILASLAPKGFQSRNRKPIRRASLRIILCNPFYTGKIRFRGESFPGNHLPLVSNDLFTRVQVLLKSGRQATH